jgi:acetyl-CoA carboxylase biotin carboxyl carrier protein
MTEPLGEGTGSVPGQAVEPAALTVDASVPVAASVPGASSVPGATPGDAVVPAAADALPAASAASAAPAEDAGPTEATGDASLLRLLDRLAGLLERSDLTELEVEAGGTGLILRKPAALAPLATVAAAGQAAGSGQRSDAAAGTARPAVGSSGGSNPSSGSSSASGLASAPAAAAASVLAVRAPLTGIFYASPGPGSPPFVAVGREVVVGQVIGLIEAMKLFNEIKSDQAGRVVRVIAEDGALVKAKQPLIEVVPL